MSPQEQELRDLKDSLQDTQPVGSLVKCCKTLDQVLLNLAVFGVSLEIGGGIVYLVQIQLVWKPQIRMRN